MKFGLCEVLLSSSADLEKIYYGNAGLAEMLEYYVGFFLVPERSLVFLGHVRNYRALEEIATCFRNKFSAIFLQREISAEHAIDYCGSISEVQKAYIEAYLHKTKASERHWSAAMQNIKTAIMYDSKLRVSLLSEIIDSIDGRKLVASVPDEQLAEIKDKNIWTELKEHICFYLSAYYMMKRVIYSALKDKGAQYDHEPGHQHIIEFHNFLAHYSMALECFKNKADYNYVLRSVWLGLMHIERAIMDIFKNVATILVKNDCLSPIEIKKLLIARQNEFNHKSGCMKVKARGYHNFFCSTKWYNGCTNGSEEQTDCLTCFLYQMNGDGDESTESAG
jgi:hypothetical protein